MVPPLPQINGYTHWKVTSSGSIIPVTSSIFHLRQPSFLLTLLRQEINSNYIQSSDIKLNLVSENLLTNQQYQKHVQNVYIDSNSACVKASKLLIEFDLHSTHILTLETKGISSKIYLKEEYLKNLKKPYQNQLKEPFCDNFFNQSFSICCFDHLDSIKNRSFLENVPEVSLYKLVFPQHLTPAEYGHLVFLALKEHYKSSSINWILYNMAAFYWRLKGSAKNSINCLRAALHTSPNQYLDVALVSLTNVLHLIKSTSKDAITLMVNAIWVSPHFSSHHLILGNIFASLGEFNNSLHHYQMAANLHRPDKDQTKLKDIEDRIFAVKCNYELSIAILNQQTNLNKQLKELNTFQHYTDRYYAAKVSIEEEKINNITQKNRQKFYETYIKYEEKEMSFSEQCFISDPILKQIVECNPIERNFVFELFKESVNSPLPESLIKESRVDFYNPSNERKYKKLFSDKKRNIRPSQEINKMFCESLNCFNFGNNKNIESYMSIHLSASNKGFDVSNILTTYQGLDENQEHPLPWYPPFCNLYVDNDGLPIIDGVDNLVSIKRLNNINSNEEHYPRIVDKTLFLELKKLVNNSDVKLEDIGQRIVTALTQNLNPQWIVLNIAGLYWRVMGSHLQAKECQLLSVKLCPVMYRDVPMINLAGILLRLNYTQDALKLTKTAMQIDYSEPETHLLVAGLFKKYENYYLAFQHFDIAIKQEPQLELAKLDRNVAKCHLCNDEPFAKHVEKSFTENDDILPISNIFMKYKMCASIRECTNIISINGRHLPHIKITLKGHSFSHTDIHSVSGYLDSLHQDDTQESQVMYGFLWNTNVSNLYILEHDCVVINDSMRTDGCYRNSEIEQSSQHAVKFLEELKYVIQYLSFNSSSQESGNKMESDHNTFLEKPIIQESLSLKFTSDDLHENIMQLITSRVTLRPLAPEDCEHVAPFDFKTYTPLYVSLNTMQVKVAALLDSLTPTYTFSFSNQPYCSPKGDNIFLQNILDKHKINFEDIPLNNVPEYNLHSSFLKTFDDKYTLEEIGKRLYTGLNQNSSDWRLATVIVNYWRVYGDAYEAFKCLQVAMQTSPDYHLKVILVNAANILYRLNKLEAALEISYKALQCLDGHNWVVIPFLVANIFSTMEQWQKATLFYESCLSIKSNFEEAIYRIKSIQCQQMVLQNFEH